MITVISCVQAVLTLKAGDTFVIPLPEDCNDPELTVLHENLSMGSLRSHATVRIDKATKAVQFVARYDSTCFGRPVKAGEVALSFTVPEGTQQERQAIGEAILNANHPQHFAFALEADEEAAPPAPTKTPAA